MPDDPDDAEQSRPSLVDRIARLVGFEPEVQEKRIASTPLGLRAKAFEGAVVGDVMIPRAAIAALEVGTPLEDVLKLFAAEAHSRMPVYRDSLDEPLGFIHIKDVVAELVRAGWSQDALASRPLDRLKRDILSTPPSMRLPDLLKQMQAKRIHIAIVIDEYGGTDGLVCLEDVVEEIVGDIEDEHDAIAPLVRRCGRQVWEVEGIADIEDVERETHLRLATGDFDSVDTIGGLVSALAGRVPSAGDIVPHPGGPVFEVIEADPRRVSRVRLRASARQAPQPLADLKTGAIDRRGA